MVEFIRDGFVRVLQLRRSAIQWFKLRWVKISGLWVLGLLL